MKKLLFSASTLDIGGIETALVALINYLAEIKSENEYKYDITLVLEKKQGLFLDTINSRIKIIEYTPDNSKIVLLRKCINFIRQIKFKIKYEDKFDFSASYATYSLPASFVARTASKNSALWCHMDYLGRFHGDKKEVKKFFNEKKFREFKTLIFVSEKSRDTFLEVFPDMKEKTVSINNIIDYKSIEEKSNENIEEKDMKIVKHNDCTIIFLNVGRHDELQKKLSRIIEAAKKLKENKFDFKVLFIGDGQDNLKYRKMVEKNDLKNEIIFLGKKKNPYPYFKIADCLLLTSDYEGSPVVYTETMILNKPIITTDVAGSEQINNKYGLITEKNATDIYEKMKNFIENGYAIKEKFDPEKYNREIVDKLKEIF